MSAPRRNMASQRGGGRQTRERAWSARLVWVALLLTVGASFMALRRKGTKAAEAAVPASTRLDEARLLGSHPVRSSPLRPQRSPTRLLMSPVERRRQLVGDPTRLTNRLCDALKRYYSQALEWFDDRGTVLFCDFLERWPTLRSVRQARTAVLERFFDAHRCRSASRISVRFESIRAAAALTDDPAINGPCRLHVLALVAQLRAVLAAIARFDQEIAQVACTLPDYALFESLLGAGPQLAPGQLAASGKQRERFRSADEVQKYAGIAPVTERSGKKRSVHWRLGCPKFLRQTFVERAVQTINR